MMRENTTQDKNNVEEHVYRDLLMKECVCELLTLV